uniref:Olfactory receptor n=1 Tax=Nothobranchius furzeri TaxID=105023 RepID=A0A8C6NPK9_NOTFU
TQFVALIIMLFLYFGIMFVVYILIICCNSTILYIIWIHKSLHEPMYIFIAALLFNSLLFSTTVCPKLLIDFLSDKQITTIWQCSFQSFVYYSLSGAELLLLSAMAYDRYVSISKPLQYHAVMKQKIVRLLLGLAWLVPACQLVPSVIISNTEKMCTFTVNGIFCNNSISKLFCMNSVASTVYVMYGVFLITNAVFVPLIFILFTYIKILAICCKSSSDVSKKAFQTCSPHLLVLISFSCLCSFDIIIARLQINLSKTTRFILNLQVVLYHPLFNPVIYGLKNSILIKLIKVLVNDKMWPICEIKILITLL